MEREEGWPEDPLTYLREMDMQSYVRNIVRRCSSLEYVSIDVRFNYKPLIPLALWRARDAGKESATVELVGENESLQVLKASPFFGRKWGQYGKEEW